MLRIHRLILASGLSIGCNSSAQDITDSKIQTHLNHLLDLKAEDQNPKHLEIDHGFSKEEIKSFEKISESQSSLLPAQKVIYYDKELDLLYLSITYFSFRFEGSQPKTAYSVIHINKKSGESSLIFKGSCYLACEAPTVVKVGSRTFISHFQQQPYQRLTYVAEQGTHYPLDLHRTLNAVSQRHMPGYRTSMTGFDFATLTWKPKVAKLDACQACTEETKVTYKFVLKDRSVFLKSVNIDFAQPMDFNK